MNVITWPSPDMAKSDVIMFEEWGIMKIFQADAMQGNQNQLKIIAHLMIGILCVICYWNSLDCDLVHDDIFAIKENMDLRPETGIGQLFQNDFWGKSMKDNTSHKSYRPLTVLTFKLNYFIHGLSPFGYHFVNVLLHAAVSVMFFIFCEVNIFQNLKLSLIASTLFVVHPVHTEAVTGVVGRAEILACMLFIISLHLYARVVSESQNLQSENNNVGHKNIKVQSKFLVVICIISGSMAMLCKENGITVFGACIAYDVFQNKEELVSFMTKKHNYRPEKLKEMFTRISIFLGSIAVLMAFRLHMLHGQLPAFNEEDNPASFAPNISARFMTYCYLCAFNVWLLLYPRHLSYDWQIGSIPLVESCADVRNIWSLLLFGGFAFLILGTLLWEKNRRSQRVTLVGISLMVISFLPASNLFIRVGFVVAERILYIPSLGFCILLAHGISFISHKLAASSDSNHEDERLANGLNHQKEESQKKRSTLSRYEGLLMVVIVIIVAILMCRTIDRNKVWRNRETLFRSGVETLPHNAKAHYNYANFLKDANRIDEAIHHYRTAVTLYPKHASSHNNLATLLGDSKEAEFHFKETLVHNPYHYKAMFNLAGLYRKTKMNTAAKTLLESALRINPDYVDAVQVLAEVLHALGQTEKGEHLYYQASLKNRNPDFFNNFGVFLGSIGKGDAAVKAYETAIELQPSHKVSVVNLGRQLKALGKFKDAEKVYRKALTLERDGNTLHLLGILLYQMKRLKESELAFLEALKHDRHNAEYIRNHAAAVFEQGQREDAIQLLKDALKITPNEVMITKTLANFLMSLNRQSDALLSINNGLKTNDKDAELHNMKANVLRELSQLDLALKSYKDVIELDPNHFSALQNIGVIYHLRGFKIEAKHYYEKAVALDPTNKILKDNIAKLQRTM